MTELENLFKKLSRDYSNHLAEVKQRHEKNLEKDLKKEILYFNSMSDNPEILEYMNKNNLSFNDIRSYFNSITLGKNMLHLEGKDNKNIQVKSVMESIHIKSGFYKIFSSKEINPEDSFEQITLIATEKGNKFFDDYAKIFALRD